MTPSTELRTAIAAHYSEEARELWLNNHAVDWQSLVHESVVTRLAPLLYDSLKKFPHDDASAETLAHLRQVYYAVGVRNTQMFEQLKRVTDTLDEIGVRYILLKGAALVHDVYGGNIALRPMSDVDVWVDSADFPLARAKLSEISQQRPSSVEDDYTIHHHGFYFENDVCVELHSRLLNYHFYRDKPAFDSVWDTSGHAVGLSGEQQFVHLCAHACYHHHQDVTHFGADAGFVCREIDWDAAIQFAVANHLLAPLQWGVNQLEAHWFVALPASAKACLHNLSPSLREHLYFLSAASVPARRVAKWVDRPTLRGKAEYLWAKVIPSRAYMETYWMRPDQERQPLWRLHLKRLVTLPRLVNTDWDEWQRRK